MTTEYVLCGINHVCMLYPQVKTLHIQVEQEQQKKNGLQSEVNQQASTLAALKARNDQLSGEVASLREGKRTAEEDLHRIKTQRSVDELQRKELQDQLEAEQYFSVSTFSVSKSSSHMFNALLTL